MVRVILHYTTEMLCCPHFQVGNWGTVFSWHPSHHAVGSWHRRVENLQNSAHGAKGLIPLCEWAAQPCRSQQHFRRCLQHQCPLTCSSWRHRANGLSHKTCCYTNTLFTFGPVKDKRLSQGPHSHESVFWKHPVISLHSLQTHAIFRVQSW